MAPNVLLIEDEPNIIEAIGLVLKRNGLTVRTHSNGVDAVEAGCDAAVVLDGRVPHAMLLEFFTARGAGTLIRKG